MIINNLISTIKESVRGLTLRDGIIYFIFPVFLAVCVFPDFYAIYAPGIDTSVFWIYNRLINERISDCRDLIFTHGPLTFLLFPIPTGNNLIIAAFIWCVAIFLFSFNFILLSRQGGSNGLMAPVLILIILLHLLEIQLLVAGIIISFYLLYFKTRKSGWIIPALLLSSVAIYIKAHAGIVCALVTLSFVGIDYYFNRKVWRSILWIILFIQCTLLFWFFLYGNLQGFLKFFYGTYQFALKNSGGSSWYPVNNWFYIGASIFIFILIPLINRDKEIRIIYALLIASAFAAWKHGMSREDIVHARGFFVFLLLIVVSGWLLAQGRFSKAEVADFYPVTCLGTWQTAQYAQGIPESLETRMVRVFDSISTKPSTPSRRGILPETVTRYSPGIVMS